MPTGQTDGRTPDRYIALSAMDVVSIVIDVRGIELLLRRLPFSETGLVVTIGSKWQTAFVCTLAYLKIHSQNFTKVSVHVACGHGSVFLWRQCATLCASGFVDNVTFSHNRANEQNQRRRVRFVEFARWRHQSLFVSVRGGNTGDEVCRIWLCLFVVVAIGCQEVLCSTRSTRRCWTSSISASRFAVRRRWCSSRASSAAGTSRRARTPRPASSEEAGSGWTPSPTTTTTTGSRDRGAAPRSPATARWPTCVNGRRSSCGTSATSSAISASTCRSSTLYVPKTVYTRRQILCCVRYSLEGNFSPHSSVNSFPKMQYDCVNYSDKYQQWVIFYLFL